MPAIRTYIDANVLVYAFQGEAEISNRAMAILDDPNREFASSYFVPLEILPHAVYANRKKEIQFYNQFFSEVKYWAALPNNGNFPKLLRGLFERFVNPFYDTKLLNRARDIALKFGINGIDAIHVAAALIVEADELVTGEKPTKPMFRAANSKFKVISILPPQNP
jgi:predicted nucleic acid-binding protein